MFQLLTILAPTTYPRVRDLKPADGYAIPNLDIQREVAAVATSYLADPVSVAQFTTNAGLFPNS
jgi:hypothetical protein